MDFFPYTSVANLLLLDIVSSRMVAPYEMVVKFSASHMFFGLRESKLMTALVESWQEERGTLGELPFAKFKNSEEFFGLPPLTRFHVEVPSSFGAVCFAQAFLRGVRPKSFLDEIEDGIVLFMVTDGSVWKFYKGRSFTERTWDTRVKRNNLGCTFKVVKD